MRGQNRAYGRRSQQRCTTARREVRSASAVSGNQVKRAGLNRNTADHLARIDSANIRRKTRSAGTDSLSRHNVEAAPCYDLRVPPRFVSITLGPNDDGRRIDRVARKAFPQLPLSRIYSALRSGEIRLNGRRIKGDVRVKAGDSLDVRERLAGGAPGGPSVDARSTGSLPHGEAAGLPTPDIHQLDGRIVHESPHLLVVAKQRGELVHGPDSLGTLVQSYLARSMAPGVSFMPGPVHRLDRNTTGLVMYAASLRGAQEMSKALRGHRVQKIYAAVLTGAVAEHQRWDARLTRDPRTRRSDEASHGQTAVTLVSPVASGRNASLVVARIVTGRTHQIRAHASVNGTPLLGDRKYGGLPFAGGYILHAGALTVTEPNEGFEAAEGSDFVHLWTPLPTSAEARVRNLFGEAALSALYELLSIPGRE